MRCKQKAKHLEVIRNEGIVHYMAWIADYSCHKLAIQRIRLRMVNERGNQVLFGIHQKKLDDILLNNRKKQWWLQDMKIAGPKDAVNIPFLFSERNFDFKA